jgi:glycerol uptake facilitator-like aquaporin
MTLKRKFAAEALGTAILLAAVVGSGIMGERLSGGNVAIALLANTLGTAATLVAIIFALGRISGAHLNPVITVAVAIRGELEWHEVPAYVVGHSAQHVWVGHLYCFSASTCRHCADLQ